MPAITVLAPHLVLLAGACALLLLGAFAGLRRGLYPTALVVTALAALAAQYGQSAQALFPAVQPASPALTAFCATGPLAAYFLPLLCALGFAGLLFLGPYARSRDMDHDEVYGLLMLALLGALLLAGGTNWLAFFLGLELLSLPFYVLIGSRRGDARAGEAAVKYLVLGATAGATLLFGIALVYAGSGSLDIAAGLADPAGPNTVLLGLGFILAGLGFKLSLAPFHLWAPDVYQGAPAPVSGLLASVAKAAAAAGLLRVLLALGPQLWPAIMPVLWIVAAATMLAANLAALAQDSVKRMLGYSSAGHMGYLLMAGVAVRAAGPGPIMYYAMALAIMDLGAFGALGLLSPTPSDADSLDDLRGLGAQRPWSVALLGVSVAALAGLPPSVGFTGKLLLFRSAVQGGYGLLAGIGILAAMLSIFYYLRVLSALFMHDAPGPDQTLPSSFAGISGGVAIALLLAAILLLGLLPAPLLDVIS